MAARRKTGVAPGTVGKRDSWERKHIRNIAGYESQVDRLYREAVREAVALVASLPEGALDPDKPFSFDEFPQLQERINFLLNGVRDDLRSIIVNGVESEWTLANNKNNELARVVFGDAVGKLSQAAYRRYFSNNDTAREAFLSRKEAGLNLSDRVWKYTTQFKREMELGLDVGIRNGLSADQMTTELRQYLQYPDKLFRRVRDEHGNLQLSKAAADFHPGQGVYRSSYKNARRLAATETNIAYRSADYERIQQFDFVVGIEVHLSNNHTTRNSKGQRIPLTDICDELAGSYPKDFKFTGWHPHCRCFTTTILKTQAEIEADTEKILKGEPINSESANAVKDVPDEFKAWLADNSDRIDRAKSIPYFLSDNPRFSGVETPRYGGVGAYSGTKLGRAAAKEAWEAYTNAEPITLSQGIKANAEEAAGAIGIKLGQPMTFAEADKGQANTGYGKGGLFRENCQCASVVHEARLRGLSITAKPYSLDKKSAQYVLGEDFNKAWINSKGKTPQVTKLSGASDEEIYRRIDQQTSSAGRYHIGLNYKNGEGHLVTAERKDGKLLIYDAQRGTFVNIWEEIGLEYAEVLKVDKLMFVVDILKQISKPI